MMVSAEKCKSYPDFIKKSIEATPVGGKFSKIARFFRKYFLVARVLRAIWIVLSVLQTGAFFLIAFTFAVIILPALLLFFMIVSLTNFFKFRKQNRIFKELLKDKKTAVYFVSDDKDAPGDGESDYTFIVHPFRFFTLRKVNERVFRIGMPYFFSLKKKVLSGENVTYTNLSEKDISAERSPQ